MKKKFCVVIDDEQMAELQRRVAKEDVSVSRRLRELIADYLNKKKTSR